MVSLHLRVGLRLLAGLLVLTVSARAQSATNYPGTVWPSRENPAEADYLLTRQGFQARYGVNDSAIAVIRLFYDQHKQRAQVFDNNGVSEHYLRRQKDKSSPMNLYVTLYHWHTEGGLPDWVKKQLPTYLERVMEVKKMYNTPQDTTSQ